MPARGKWNPAKRAKPKWPPWPKERRRGCGGSSPNDGPNAMVRAMAQLLGKEKSPWVRGL